MPSLDPELIHGRKLGLEGEHQYLNAGLAIALSSAWLHRTGHSKLSYVEHSVSSTYEICLQSSITLSCVFFFCLTTYEICQHYLVFSDSFSF